MDQIRLGVIGMGMRARAMIRKFQAIDPGLRVVGIIDPDEPGARSRLSEPDSREAAFYPSLLKLLSGSRPDALLIGTRCHQHAPFAIEAARYDLPLFLEKPVANSMAQAEALENVFENSRCEVVVSFPLRVSPLCVLARRQIEEGAVGSPEHVLASNYVPYGTVYFEAAYRNYAVTQGLFLQKATHDFDYLMHLMNSRIVRVGAMHSRGRVFGGDKPAGLVCSKCDETATCLESPVHREKNKSGYAKDHFCLFSRDIGTPESGMNEDSSSALVEFASGAHGAYTQVFYSRGDAATRGATVSGYHGTISFDWYTNVLRRVRHHGPGSERIEVGKDDAHFGGDSILASDFIEVVRGRAQTRTPIGAGIQSVYTCLAAKQSAETGQFVTVRQVGSAGAAGG